jgi:hypothetical protein
VFPSLKRNTKVWASKLLPHCYFGRRRTGNRAAFFVPRSRGDAMLIDYILETIQR